MNNRSNKRITIIKFKTSGKAMSDQTVLFTLEYTSLKVKFSKLLYSSWNPEMKVRSINIDNFN